MKKVLEFHYNFDQHTCDFCQVDKPVMFFHEAKYPHSPPICESCALLVHHFWSRAQDFRTETEITFHQPRSVFVLIANERKNDVANPCDFLMVEHSDLGFFLPGGRAILGETPAEGACRLLKSTTGLTTWPGALEQLHLSHDVRGRLTQTFLCRAYAGKIEGAVFVGSPLSSHYSFHQSMHLGIEQAFLGRVKFQDHKAPDSPLSVHLSHAGQLWISSKLESMLPEIEQTDSDRKLRDAYWMSLDTHEQKACRLVIALETALKEAVSVGSPAQNFALASALAAKQMQPQTQPVVARTETLPLPADDFLDVESSDGDDNDDEMFGERQSGGFTPPRK